LIPRVKGPLIFFIFSRERPISLVIIQPPLKRVTKGIVREGFMMPGEILEYLPGRVSEVLWKKEKDFQTGWRAGWPGFQEFAPTGRAKTGEKQTKKFVNIWPLVCRRFVPR